MTATFLQWANRVKVIPFIHLGQIRTADWLIPVPPKFPHPADTVASPTSSFGSRALRRMLAAFTYRDFRVQWFGACSSSIGTWMQLTAQNWMVLSLTGSAFFLGLDAFLQQLPIMLFTLIGGVLADRRDRRRTLLASQYIQMATAATLAAARLLRRRRDLAHPAALVHDRPRPGVRRPGLPVAHPVARRQEGSAERGRAQLDSVQHRARARPARLRRHDRRLRATGASAIRRRWRPASP